MPFKSKAQQRWMFAAEARGEVPKGTAREWAHETKDIKKLPERKKHAARADRTPEPNIASAEELSRQNLRKGDLDHYQSVPLTHNTLSALGWGALGGNIVGSFMGHPRAGMLIGGIGNAAARAANNANYNKNLEERKKSLSKKASIEDPFWDGFGKEAAAPTKALRRLGKLGVNDVDGFLSNFGKSQTTHQGILKRANGDAVAHQSKAAIIEDKRATTSEKIRRLEKLSAGNSVGLSMLELAGLGTLAVPALAGLSGHHMKEKHKDAFEVAGLGILAAPYARDLGSAALKIDYKGIAKNAPSYAKNLGHAARNVDHAGLAKSVPTMAKQLGSQSLAKLKPLAASGLQALKKLGPKFA